MLRRVSIVCAMIVALFATAAAGPAHADEYTEEQIAAMAAPWNDLQHLNGNSPWDAAVLLDTLWAYGLPGQGTVAYYSPGLGGELNDALDFGSGRPAAAAGTGWQTDGKPDPELCSDRDQAVSQINRVSNTLWVVSGAWASAAAMIGLTGVGAAFAAPMAAVAAISATLAGVVGWAGSEIASRECKPQR